MDNKQQYDLIPGKSDTDARVDVKMGTDMEKDVSYDNNDDKVTPPVSPTDSIVSEMDIQIPSRMDVFYDLNGSLGFAIGSSGFILAMYYEDWLSYFRYGSLVWIWGCIFYSIPLFLKFKQTSQDEKNNRLCSIPWDIEDWGVFLCCLFYTIGCILGAFFNEEKVDSFLPAINHTFVYGSFSLALEPVYSLLLFLRRKVTSESKDDNDSDSLCNEDERKLQRWDRFFELSAMVFFCAAGVFGGFPPHPSLALPGVYFWEVGSLFAVARSILMMHRRNVGLKSLQQKNLADNIAKSSLRRHRGIINV